MKAMAGVAQHSWLRHPLAEPLLRFSLLPAQWLHRSRDLIPRALRGAHRQSAVTLFEKFGLDPMVQVTDPALPLAMLPQASFDRVLLLVGAAMNAMQIRRTIGRAACAELDAQLGADGVLMAQSATAVALGGMPPASDWQVARARELCMASGSALVALAFDAATSGVCTRGHLRLEEADVQSRLALAAAGMEPARALAIALDLLEHLEPTWLSSFRELA
jgi:hypothetical protein